MSGSPTTRRSFFGAAGGVALLCTIGGEQVEVAGPQRLRKADAAAARVRAGRVPRSPRRSRRSSPRPGGVRKRVLDPGRDRALGDHADAARRVARPRVLGGRNVFTAFVYREMTRGLRRATRSIGRRSPGRRCTPRSATCSSCTSATATRSCARRSRCTRTASSTTRSTTAPTWASSRARAASSRPASRSPTSGSARRTRSAPGRTTTTGPTTRSTRSAGCSARSSCARAAPSGPIASTRCSPTSSPPPVTGLERNFHCFNGRAYAGNTPTLTARVGEDVEIHAIGMDSNFHTFHIHGHRWQRSGGGVHRQPGVRAQRDRHGPLRRGQPGSLALPLPRLLASGRGDGGLVRGRPVGERRGALRTSCSPLLVVALLVAGRRAARRRTPSPRSPARSSPRPRARTRRYTVCKQGCDFQSIQKAVDKAQAPATRCASRTAPTARP